MTDEPKRRGRPPKAGTADPVPGDNGEALARITEFFKAQYPEHWESLRLCPLQHGLEDMAALLKG